MRGMLTIAQRDFRALFYSPSGYVVAALFSLISGIVFMRQVFLAGQPASMSNLLDFDALLLLVPTGPVVEATGIDAALEVAVEPMQKIACKRR